MTVHTTSPEEAAAFVRAGEVVAFPTETVYGLGADTFNTVAISKIFTAKGRPADNPLIVHVAWCEQLEEVVADVPEMAAQLIDTFFPGPLTLILPKRPEVPALVTGGLDTVGVRMPRHPVALAFLEACERPVAAPSANRSGRPSPTSWQAVSTDLDGHIACILQGDRSEVGLESTVLDCTGRVPAVLRAGVVTLEMLRAVIPDVQPPNPRATASRRSPGTRYRHYAPRATVQLVNDPAEARPTPSTAYVGLQPPTASGFGLVEVCANKTHYAHVLFEFFRRCDAAGLQTIYCQTVRPTGIGLALMDRLQRAAQR